MSTSEYIEKSKHPLGLPSLEPTDEKTHENTSIQSNKPTKSSAPIAQPMTFMRSNKRKLDRQNNMLDLEEPPNKKQKTNTNVNSGKSMDPVLQCIDNLKQTYTMSNTNRENHIDELTQKLSKYSKENKELKEDLKKVRLEFNVFKNKAKKERQNLANMYNTVVSQVNSFKKWKAIVLGNIPK
eukprot:143649_1